MKMELNYVPSWSTGNYVPSQDHIGVWTQASVTYLQIWHSIYHKIRSRECCWSFWVIKQTDPWFHLYLKLTMLCQVHIERKSKTCWTVLHLRWFCMLKMWLSAPFLDLVWASYAFISGPYRNYVNERDMWLSIYGFCMLKENLVVNVVGVDLLLWGPWYCGVDFSHVVVMVVVTNLIMWNL